jgi:hypothetical protein
MKLVGRLLMRINVEDQPKLRMPANAMASVSKVEGAGPDNKKSWSAQSANHFATTMVP